MSIPSDPNIGEHSYISPLPPPTVANETPLFRMNAQQQQTFHLLSQSFAQVIQAYKQLSQFTGKAMNS